MSGQARALVLQLFVLRDGDLVASEMFAEGTYLLGGEPDSDVLLEHPSVAPVHLEFREGKVRLSGSGGFHLNGVRVAEAQLSSADDVWLGPFLLKTRIMGRRRTAGTQGGPAGKSHRVGGAALALVPEPPPPPAMEFEPAEVERLLAEPLIAAAEPVALADLDELADEEAQALLTPLVERVEATPAAPPILQPEPPAEPVQRPAALLAPARLSPPLEETRPAPPPTQPPGAGRPREPSGPGRTAPKAKPSAPAAMGLVHARVFWEETLLFSASSSAAQPFAARTEAAALQQYGFVPGGVPLVRPAGSLFRVKVPEHALAFQRNIDGWTPADPGAGREILLAAGSAVRISNARFHLELSAQPAPQKVGGTLLRDLDLRLLALLLLLGGALFIFLRTLPKPLPVALEPETIRHVQMTIAQKPKVEKAKPKPRPAEEPKPVVPLAQVTSLKQANVPLHSLDKIARATKGLSSLLSSLTATPGAAKKDLLAGLPAVDRGPAPLPSLGGSGASGPVTKGSELLRGGRGGLLAAATGGQGEVRGVPVSLPKRPTRVQGSIDRDAVAKVINDKVSEMRACYERALLRDPNLGAGKVLLEWTIDGKGAVSEVRTKSSTLRSPEVVSCLLDLLRTLQFPKPNDGVVIVSYPVLFNSVGY